MSVRIAVARALALPTRYPLVHCAFGGHEVEKYSVVECPSHASRDEPAREGSVATVVLDKDRETDPVPVPRVRYIH